MRWWDWLLKPSTCEIPGCGAPPARRAWITAQSRAWLCQAHAERLDVGAPVRVDRHHPGLPQTPRAA